MTSKIKNSQYGEVRSKKLFQILKELTKTRPMIYFSSQTDNMTLRNIRITDLFNIQEGSKSPSGGNQVDGLPPAPVEVMDPISRVRGRTDHCASVITLRDRSLT